MKASFFTAAGLSTMTVGLSFPLVPFWSTSLPLLSLACHWSTVFVQCEVVPIAHHPARQDQDGTAASLFWSSAAAPFKRKEEQPTVDSEAKEVHEELLFYMDMTSERIRKVLDEFNAVNTNRAESVVQAENTISELQQQIEIYRVEKETMLQEQERMSMRLDAELDKQRQLGDEAKSIQASKDEIIRALEREKAELMAKLQTTYKVSEAERRIWSDERLLLEEQIDALQVAQSKLQQDLEQQNRMLRDNATNYEHRINELQQLYKQAELTQQRCSEDLDEEKLSRAHIQTGCEEKYASMQMLIEEQSHSLLLSKENDATVIAALQNTINELQMTQEQYKAEYTEVVSRFDEERAALQHEMEGREREMEDMKSIVEDRNRQLEDSAVKCNQQREVLEHDISERIAHTQQLEAVILSMKEEIRQHENTIAENRLLQQKLSDSEQNREQLLLLSSQQQEANDEALALREDAEQLELELVKCREEEVQLQTAYNELMDEKNILSQEYNSEKQSKAVVDENNTQLESQIRDLRATLDTVDRNLAECQSRENDVVSRSDVCHAIESELKAKNEELQVLHADLIQLQRQMSTATDSGVASVGEECASYVSELQTLRNENIVLREEVQTISSRNDELHHDVDVCVEHNVKLTELEDQYRQLQSSAQECDVMREDIVRLDQRLNQCHDNEVEMIASIDAITKERENCHNTVVKQQEICQNEQIALQNKLSEMENVLEHCNASKQAVLDDNMHIHAASSDCNDRIQALLQDSEELSSRISSYSDEQQTCESRYLDRIGELERSNSALEDRLNENALVITDLHTKVVSCEDTAYELDSLRGLYQSLHESKERLSQSLSITDETVDILTHRLRYAEDINNKVRQELDDEKQQSSRMLVTIDELRGSLQNRTEYCSVQPQLNDASISWLYQRISHLYARNSVLQRRVISCQDEVNLVKESLFDVRQDLFTSRQRSVRHPTSTYSVASTSKTKPGRYLSSLQDIEYLSATDDKALYRLYSYLDDLYDKVKHMLYDTLLYASSTLSTTRATLQLPPKLQHHAYMIFGLLQHGAIAVRQEVQAVLHETITHPSIYPYTKPLIVATTEYTSDLGTFLDNAYTVVKKYQQRYDRAWLHTAKEKASTFVHHVRQLHNATIQQTRQAVFFVYAIAYMEDWGLVSTVASRVYKFYYELVTITEIVAVCLVIRRLYRGRRLLRSTGRVKFSRKPTTVVSKRT